MPYTDRKLRTKTKTPRPKPGSKPPLRIFPSLLEYGGHTVDEHPLPPLKHDPNVEVILMTGTSINPLGHTAIRVETKSGPAYLHVDKIAGKPLWMTEEEYIAVTKRAKLNAIHKIKIPNVQGFEAEIKEKMAEDYLWIAGIHDCGTFVVDLLRAGGIEINYFELWDENW